MTTKEYTTENLEQQALKVCFLLDTKQSANIAASARLARTASINGNETEVTQILNDLLVELDELKQAAHFWETTEIEYAAILANGILSRNLQLAR